ncbi:MAG: PTS sugar transporter subunit IIB [Elusimicrobia bacterium]|jgi:mannose/fructose/N-acetylgalactosamine-specific phosphotransferase system component IIB|nr:PTS sugar transporter subunit IIB [Elusimicrobiota bacterium]
MTKVIFRLDDRLIHGQVIEGWVHNLELTRIVVASERVKKDKELSKILKFSSPAEINVVIVGIKELADKIERGYLKEEDTIVLFEKAEDVLMLLDNGADIKYLNVGCLHSNKDKKQICRNIIASEQDIEVFKDIDSMGVTMDTRALPQNTKINLMKEIDKS